MSSRTTRPDAPCGLVIVDKPAGPTSHDVIDRLRRATRMRRIGHAGTLDPAATGVLVTCLGRATRLLRFLAGLDKTYEGRVSFGIATDTDDAAGRPLGERERPGFSQADVEDAVRELTGELRQVPPAYSAKKLGGVRSHALARRGRAVELDAATVRVHEWSPGRLHDDQLPFTVRCSSGTYVRALARDLGVLLGCPAHLAELRRVAVGPFDLHGALTVERPTEAEVMSVLVPIDEIPLPLPDVVVGGGGAADFGHGRTVGVGEWEGADESGAEVAVRAADSSLLGVARVEPGGGLRPTLVLSPG